MELSEIKQGVEPPIDATALVVDLRNFTPSLNASQEDLNGVNTFCYFLFDFYQIILKCCLLAIPAPLRNNPPLQINSTGDGALIVYYNTWNFAYGFLAAILLDAYLSSFCREFNLKNSQNNLPEVSFGIGIESGKVSRIFAHNSINTTRPVIDTFIGYAINIASRAESISKTLFAANTIFSDATVEKVSQSLFQENYQDKRNQDAICKSDDERLIIHEKMNELNHKLCLAFIGRYNLQGVSQPMPLYRLSRYALKPGMKRFDTLIKKLVQSDSQHFKEIVNFL
ncbi:hypothetical protein NIES2119_25900 [[Phormidium ambiguum] IAM M-71]|uniref:Guanylate cyclase domain-containing protein n=1 Tax=[Phormidium ambiguum] IAM M-71 TaxID=454136 RepID=A0A1U7I7Z2_9CYAN|nr:adenylate/guanylate cyclase domain-containing protein [Phormidium ambiguum]OKH32571.1 hypothetical protein NIES2119_25900 [Phormidium ambiguum IAM M-71]